MDANNGVMRHCLRTLTLLTVAALLSSAHGQTGATMVSPKSGEVYYAGYEGDTIASWDSLIIQWTYDDTSGPRLVSNTTVLEISPDDGLNWVTFTTGSGTKRRITSSKYFCKIDTFGYDIQSASDPGRSLISETCRARVYDYVARGFGGVSGMFSVRRGPPPAGVIRSSRGVRDGFRPSVAQSVNGGRAMTLAVLGGNKSNGVICGVDGRAMISWDGSRAGSPLSHAPAGVLFFRVKGENRLGVSGSAVSR